MFWRHLYWKPQSHHHLICVNFCFICGVGCLLIILLVLFKSCILNLRISCTASCNFLLTEWKCFTCSNGDSISIMLRCTLQINLSISRTFSSRAGVAEWKDDSDLTSDQNEVRFRSKESNPHQTVDPHRLWYKVIPSLKGQHKSAVQFVLEIFSGHQCQTLSYENQFHKKDWFFRTTLFLLQWFHSG